jgi:hypothetical protein
MLPGVFDLSPLSRAADRHDIHDAFTASAGLPGCRHESSIGRLPGIGHALV